MTSGRNAEVTPQGVYLERPPVAAPGGRQQPIHRTPFERSLPAIARVAPRKNRKSGSRRLARSIPDVGSADRRESGAEAK